MTAKKARNAITVAPSALRLPQAMEYLGLAETTEIIKKLSASKNIVWIQRSSGITRDDYWLYLGPDGVECREEEGCVVPTASHVFIDGDFEFVWAEGDDTRGGGGYVIVPPSPGYTWLNGSDLSGLPPFPADLAARIARYEKSPRVPSQILPSNVVGSSKVENPTNRSSSAH
jgi:hypothetical protein